MLWIAFQQNHPVLQPRLRNKMKPVKYISKIYIHLWHLNGKDRMGTKVLVGIVNQGWIFDFDRTMLWVHGEFCLMSMRVGFGGRHHLRHKAEAAFQAHASQWYQPVIMAVKSTACRRMTKSIALGAGKVPWLKFSQNKTSFVWSLFARPSQRQKSIPHDAFIVFSRTHTRAHICRHCYCTTIVASESS